MQRSLYNFDTWDPFISHSGSSYYYPSSINSFDSWTLKHNPSLKINFDGNPVIKKKEKKRKSWVESDSFGNAKLKTSVVQKWNA